MQDGDFLNCKVNFAPLFLKDGSERKQDIVWSSIGLKISTSQLKSLCLRIDLVRGDVRQNTLYVRAGGV